MVYAQIKGLDCNNKEECDKVKDALFKIGYSLEEVTPYTALIQDEVQYRLENGYVVSNDDIDKLSENEYESMVELINEKLDNIEEVVNLDLIDEYTKDSYESIINKRYN